MSGHAGGSGRGDNSSTAGAALAFSGPSGPGALPAPITASAAERRSPAPARETCDFARPDSKHAEARELPSADITGASATRRIAKKW